MEILKMKIVVTEMKMDFQEIASKFHTVIENINELENLQKLPKFKEPWKTPVNRCN